MEHLERRLFTDPRPQHSKDAPNTEGLEILAAAGPLGELEMIASRIKRLLIEGHARPQDVAVVFRLPQDCSTPAGEVFARYGIPVAWECGPTLDRSPFLRALAAILRVDLEDWPFQTLLSALGSNYFQPDWPEWQNGRAAIHVERTLRDLQIPLGRRNWLEQSSRHTPCAGEDLTGAGTRSVPATILEKLASVFDALPARATLAEWANAWRRLAEETGMFRASSRHTPCAEEDLTSAGTRRVPATLDRTAWEHLERLLHETGTLARWLGQRLSEIDRREAYQTLVDLLASQRLPVEEDGSGCVRILSAESIRALHLPYVFLAGLSEKKFPLPDREDRLYSEAEYQRLIEEGLPLPDRTERNRGEMLLFYEVVTRATKRLTLSYPALNEAAEPLSPSPYVTEVKEACGETPIACWRADDFRPLPKSAEPLCPADLRLLAMVRGLEGDGSMLAALLDQQTGWSSVVGRRSSEFVVPRPTTNDQRPTTPNLWAGIETAVSREDRRFGPVDGLFFSPAAQVVFHEKFSPQRTFTATELERYASCPFRFLLEHVLQIVPPADLRIQADVLQRGQMVHAVLAEFHQEVNRTLGRPGSPAELEPAVFEELVQAALKSVFKPGKTPLQAALAEIDRRLIAGWLADYRRQTEQYDRLWKKCQSPLAPEFFEISFGRTQHPSTTWAVEEPLACETSQGTIRVAGRIDRVDTGQVANRAVFNIVDYKTGRSAKFSKEAVFRGTALQLPLYAIAVPELFLIDRDPYPWQAGYWIVSGGGFQAKNSLKMYQQTEDKLEASPDWDEIRLALREIVGGLIRNLRQGHFPAFNFDEHCTGSCPFHTICRINAQRALDKTWSPPGENAVQTP
jgi:ATP-dependent helicase/nuclease subunit B